jgi:hypothetical protein
MHAPSLMRLLKPALKLSAQPLRVAFLHVTLYGSPKISSKTFFEGQTFFVTSYDHNHMHAWYDVESNYRYVYHSRYVKAS